ncbi:MAG: hypothetical protein AB7N54_19395 [Alphaproteobacteria bacterium]
MNAEADVADIWRRLVEYDLADVERWYAEKNGLPRSHAIEVSQELRRYFLLCWIDRDRQRNGMTDCPVDRFWHFFLLFTPDYRRFCEATVGFFIDHNPGLYWRPEMNPEARCRHLASARLYAETFGTKPPRRFWQHVEADATAPAVMPGSLCGDAELLTPDGPRLVRDVQPGDVVISADGEITRIAYVAAWPVADMSCLRYPGHDWFLTANLVLHAGRGQRVAVRPDLATAADGVRFLADGTDGVRPLTWRYARDGFADWPASGLVPHAPSPREMVWFIAAPGGFRIRGGLRVFGSMEAPA